jgi:hypothetical protein
MAAVSVPADPERVLKEIEFIDTRSKNPIFSCQFVQKKDQVYVVQKDKSTNTSKELDHFAATESVEELWNDFISGMVGAGMEMIHPSRLDERVLISPRSGCVTMILRKRNRCLCGHAELIFEAIENSTYKVWLAHISNVNSPAGWADILVEDRSGKSVIKDAQTETWTLPTERITAMVRRLRQLGEAQKKVRFFKGGKGTRGVPATANNCLTWAVEILSKLGIVLYKDVYNFHPSTLGTWFGADSVASPSATICNKSPYSKRRVVVEITVTDENRTFLAKADVTTRIHNAVKEVSWKCDQEVYTATAAKNDNRFYVRNIQRIFVTVRNEQNPINKTDEVIAEVEDQLNTPPYEDTILNGIGRLFQRCRRSAFDWRSIELDLQEHLAISSKALRLWYL